MLNNALKAGLLTAAVLVAVPLRAAAADISVNVSVFHDRLAPYGEWISVSGYGTCWRPHHVVRTWRPYTAGHWVYTDYGWTWVSYEDWGWATYHYGRWFYDSYYGWVWVPGPQWAPAYVTWRYSDDWIGWAPLPPGVEPGVFVNVDIASSSYTFVQTRYFLDRQLSGHFASVSRNAVLLRSTRNVTRYDVHGSRIVDRGVDRRQIEHVAGRRVVPLRVRDATTVTRARVATHALSVYRPVARRGHRQVPAFKAPPARTGRRSTIERRQAAPQERATPAPVPGGGPHGGGGKARHGGASGGPNRGGRGKGQKGGGSKHEKG